ncbi:MAG: hypothetical protein JNM84_06440 [Planctomycetes bacterium]|nr:hypothetical protein [Planctomycetota bacterium]
MTIRCTSRLFATLALAFATIGFASDASAQTVRLRGEVVNGRATGCYYCPGYEFALKWTETAIASRMVSIGAFLHQQVEVEGVWDPSTNPPHLEVSAIRAVPETFSIDGTERIGDRMRFTSTGTPGELAANFLGFDAGFFPLGGTLAMTLDPQTMFFLGAGAMNGNGEFKSDVNLPNDPRLVGLRFIGQALMTSGGAAVIFSTNPDSKTVQG